MNEEEELPDLVPNLNTDWVPPLPANGLNSGIKS